MNDNPDGVSAMSAELGQPPARWYCVSNDGMAMLCRDERDARLQATDGDTLYPRHAPHKAVLLGDVAAERKRWRSIVSRAAADANRYGREGIKATCEASETGAMLSWRMDMA